METEAIDNTESEIAPLNGSHSLQRTYLITGVSTPEQALSPVSARQPSNIIVMDSEERQELESSTAMVLALSEDEITEVSLLESHF